MVRLVSAFALSLAQLSDPAILKVLAKSLALTLALFGLFGWGLSVLLGEAFARWGIADGGPAGTLVASLATVIAAWLLLRIVALFVLQFFADEVVLAVERRHYPQALAAARRVPLREELASGLRALARTIGVNLAAMPLAVLLLATGIGVPLLFGVINAWLLGRELQDMAWLRHRHHRHAAAPLGRATRMALGGMVTALLLVPFVNLVAPVLGAAAATHLVHRDRHGKD